LITVASESETGRRLRLEEASPRPSGQIGIDQVRALEGWMGPTPHSGRWKVAILDGADSLTEQAAHACLKLLEEPPEKSILLLIATALHRLPATLVSRCHLVRCAPQGIGRVARFLQEDERLDPALSGMLATCAGGRLGLALRFHREERLSAKNAAIDQLLKGWREGAVEVPLGNAPRPEVQESLDWLAAWWRDLLVLSLGGDPAWLIHQDRLWEIQKEAGGLPLVEELLERIERAYWVQEAIQRNASPRIGLAALLSR
ncbi:MAG: hypothetical protein HYZ93_01540, partial [Candidatus Omnitrophica bacterium]|nr:hypothetical protein [Candidatus Omnitrophota bacterium]